MKPIPITDSNQLKRMNRFLFLSCLFALISVVTAALPFVSISIALIGIVFSFLSMQRERRFHINVATILNLIGILLAVISWTLLSV